MSFTRGFIVALALVTAGSITDDAFARRLGAGGRAGMQRTLPPQPATSPAATPKAPTAPAANPAPAATPMAGAPAPAPRRSWLGPVAGLAAGLGLAALMSHLGFGAEFGSLLVIALLGFAVLFVVRALMRRSSTAPAYAGSGAAMPSAGSGWPSAPVTPTLNLPPSAATGAVPLPQGFDTEGLASTAKEIFTRMQSANDAGRLEELQAFTTPDLYASIRDDIAARGGRAQRTDVVRIDADVIDVATEGPQQVVSVRFHGLLREAADAVAEPFDEVWHLVRPLDGSRPWAIAGIQQTA
jgi:predicted lipid-binding transport protein (Tim44 family)